MSNFLNVGLIRKLGEDCSVNQLDRQFCTEEVLSKDNLNFNSQYKRFIPMIDKKVHPDYIGYNSYVISLISAECNKTNGIEEKLKVGVRYFKCAIAAANYYNEIKAFATNNIAYFIYRKVNDYEILESTKLYNQKFQEFIFPSINYSQNICLNN